MSHGLYLREAGQKVYRFRLCIDEENTSQFTVRFSFRVLGFLN